MEIRRSSTSKPTPTLNMFGRLLVVSILGMLFLINPVDSKTKGRGVNRHIQIINDSRSKIEVFWVHPDTREGHLMSPDGVVPGADFPLDSFVGHEFEVREVAAKDGSCLNESKTCRRSLFAVSDNDDQVARITDDFHALFEDNKIKAHAEAGALIGECQARAQAKLEGAGKDKQAASAAMEELVKCVQGGVATTLEKVNEEIAFQASVRTDIAAKLENYTCIDDALESTKDVDTSVWIHEGEPGGRRVHIKHDRPASQIHVIENFILQDECDAMEASAAKTLHRATVADGKGGSRLSENRKAMQAGITVPWHLEEQDNPIARVSRRVYDYANHVLGMGIEEHGQEDLMSIQYFGRGANDTEPDRYTPHCDGDCTGLPHKAGTRMATMVMYCVTADKGGHTNFRNAGVHVKPEKFDAVFFSYVDPVSRITDKGFTEHSGCPVYEGEKKIVTQWIRYGVDKENPWDSFNTLGIKKSEVQKLESMLAEGMDDEE